MSHRGRKTRERSIRGLSRLTFRFRMCRLGSGWSPAAVLAPAARQTGWHAPKAGHARHGSGYSLRSYTLAHDKAEVGPCQRTAQIRCPQWNAGPGPS